MEDLRRSGARYIPEALRMAPGLEVARLDANKWAVSSRGSNGRLGNKLLVLMDGQNVYTPLFSGGGHRAHRGHPRPRRHDVGLERRQRRHLELDVGPR